MNNVKVRAFICIDEHGNYRIIGSSAITDDNRHTAISIIEDDIRKDGVNSVTTSFQVNIELPQQTQVETQTTEEATNE